ncbi:MAG: hypothetical protein ACTSQC_10270, partial [Candidatus Heimdallarchaeaceae archaeon]
LPYVGSCGKSCLFLVLSFTPFKSAMLSMWCFSCSFPLLSACLKCRKNPDICATLKYDVGNSPT